MTVERKELALNMPDNSQEKFRILRMLDDNGDEKIWEMHSFLEEMYPPFHIETKEKYEEYINQWAEILEFPIWEEAAIPGVGIVISALSDYMSQKEIHQWLFDIYYDMWKAYQVQSGYIVVEKVLIDAPSVELDGLRVPQMTIGVLLKIPNPCLTMLYLPDMPEFNPPMLGASMTLNAYMAKGHEKPAIHLSIPLIWNVTQNKPNVFSRGDKCKIRFGQTSTTYYVDHPEHMTSWEAMPYSQVWNLWK